MNLSVVIPTRNEGANISACILSFAAATDWIDVVVVDNFSEDDTVAKAEILGARVFSKGPERSAQRNLGWREAHGDWILFLDADMVLPVETLREIERKTALPDAADAYWMPETRTGTGLRARARNFERSFYNGTCVDGLRLFRRTLLERVGGYDEALFAAEDWDLDIRVRKAGARTAMLDGCVMHNEKALSLGRVLKKKAYYAGSFAKYKAKWPGETAVKRQFSPFYRFIGVFVEDGKWRRLLRHPLLALVMYCERIAVGLVYLLKR